MKLTGKRAEPIRFLICTVIVGFLMLMIGLKYNWWDSIDRAAMDCDRYLAFEYEGRTYGCYVVGSVNERRP